MNKYTQMNSAFAVQNCFEKMRIRVCVVREDVTRYDDESKQPVKVYLHVYFDTKF
jgi:hypothetical protein